jgi:hypothetical protein
MRNLLFLLVLSLLLNSCATADKMTNEAIHNAIIGQDEKMVCYRLGMPARTVPATNGGKIMIYEHYSKGMFLTPYKSSITYNANKNLMGESEGWTYTNNVNTAANDPKYTIYPTEVYYLKVYLDKQGKAVRLEHTLPKEQLEIYHERFKHFSPKD